MYAVYSMNDSYSISSNQITKATIKAIIINMQIVKDNEVLQTLLIVFSTFLWHWHKMSCPCPLCVYCF